MKISKRLFKIRLIIMLGFLFCLVSLPSTPFELGIKTSGILDRYEDNEHAVVLIEAMNKELIVQRDVLPYGSRINTVFNIYVKDGAFEVISICDYKTVKAAQKSSLLMKKLRQRK